VQPQITLKEGQQSYDFIISKKLQDKINVLCNKIHTIEWSGVLFYKKKGSFEKNNLVITGLDLIPMDIGDAGTTEFDINSDVIDYMLENNMNGNKVFMGLVHSHHNLSAFFSSTDSNTLLEQGKNVNHFVSLIVCNSGPYVAAITTHIKATKKYYITKNYESFNATPKVSSDETEEVVEYILSNTLNIKSETLESPYDILIENRLNLIRDDKKKEEEARIAKGKTLYKDYPGLQTGYQNNQYGYQGYNPNRHWGTANIPPKTTPKFEVNPAYKKKETPIYVADIIDDDMGLDIPYGEVTIKNNTVVKTISQLLLGSILVPDKFDPEVFALTMEKLYDSNFTNIKHYESFIVTFLDYIINDIDEGVIETCKDPVNRTAIVAQSILAAQIQDILQDYPKNKYLDLIITSLGDFIYN